MSRQLWAWHPIFEINFVSAGTFMPNLVSLVLIIIRICVFTQTNGRIDWYDSNDLPNTIQEYILYTASIYILWGVCHASLCLLQTFSQSHFTLSMLKECLEMTKLLPTHAHCSFSLAKRNLCSNHYPPPQPPPAHTHTHTHSLSIRSLAPLLINLWILWDLKIVFNWSQSVRLLGVSLMFEWNRSSRALYCPNV